MLQSILRECVQPISKRARPEALTNAREVVRLCVSRDTGRQRLLERLDASVLAGVGRDMGPQKAALVLAQAKGQGLDMGAYIKVARVEAMLQSCPKSLASHASALRCWALFSDTVLGANGRHLPPSVEGLVAWSTTFRTANVFGNYLAGVRFACQLADIPFEHTFHADVTRAKQAIKKREGPGRPKMHLQWRVVSRISCLAEAEHEITEAMLYRLAYWFLLRVRSECLPIEVGTKDEAHHDLPQGRHSALVLVDSKLVLRLRTRKNKQHGSTLYRTCVCMDGAKPNDGCPVHVIGKWIESMPAGCRVFEGITADAALKPLRRRLVSIGVTGASHYCLHDFRRGHAQDLVENGASLAMILQAGEWASQAFATYLKMVEVEAHAVRQASHGAMHVINASDDEE